jgi:glycosyltransferase involved in cell wall biosynthesis
MAAGEAQACGTPVVAFRRGALSEVIMDGVPHGRPATAPRFGRGRRLAAQGRNG